MASLRAARTPRVALALVALWLAGTPGGAAPVTPSREYEIKAAFLFNFVQFVEWPAEAFASAEAPICIGILGEDPFGSVLEEMVRDETVREHPLTVRRSRSADDFADCHLLFISRSEHGRLREQLSALAARPILTVGEVEGFAQAGGIINFRIDGNRVRFEINPAVAERERLKISSQLLSLGTLVGPAAER